MQIKISEDEKDWIERAIDSEHTKLQIKKKLEEAKYPNEKVDLMIKYYDLLQNNSKELETEENKESEEDFKESVKSYFDKGKKELSWSERRAVKKFLKNIKKYSDIMKVTIEGFKTEIEELNKKGLNQKGLDREYNYLKEEIIDRIVESKSVLDIEHPKTREEVTKENLKTLTIEELTDMMKENVDTLNLIVEGKIVE